MKHSVLTSQIISLCIKVHKIFGPGLLESVYEEALCYELAQAGIPFKRQKGIPVTYGEIKLDMGFRADLIIAEKVLLELKSVEAISPVHAKILLTYLKLSGIELGLLINFNVPMLKNGITRVIYDRDSVGFTSNEVS